MRGSGLSERSSLHAIERPSEVFAETPKLGRLELPDNRRHTITQPDCVSGGGYFAITWDELVFFKFTSTSVLWMSPTTLGRHLQPAGCPSIYAMSVFLQGKRPIPYHSRRIGRGISFQVYSGSALKLVAIDDRGIGPS
ncbi:uncharacterized protein KD926_010975 [Aspergillus affinis]|uniref:uncharacterized protein n=1 Tax=Aspergillus affinis TaxID=1070780 RepID=UPI0022FDC6AD|nr:uncharacterized protein KD926_010975 [Aspergillus affinis]KAI9044803.1 hypothetical protein KD926_010975 [Aspergillus affinis]